MSHAKSEGGDRRWKQLGPHQQYQRMYVLAITVMDLLYGATYLLGGPANSASQALMRELLPMQIWGGTLVVVAGLMWARFYTVGSVLGSTVWMVFTLASLVTVVQGTALSSGGPVLFIGVVVLHMLITYGAMSGLSTSAR